MNLNEIITAAEAAEILNVSSRQIQRLCKTGKFTARQDESGSWLILRASVVDKDFQSNKDLFEELADLVYKVYSHANRKKLIINTHGDFHDLLLKGLPEKLIKVGQAFTNLSNIELHHANKVVIALESTKAKFLERFSETDNLFNFNVPDDHATNYSYYIGRIFNLMIERDIKQNVVVDDQL